MSNKVWTIIGALGTIDYMGNDRYVAHFWDEATTHVFKTTDLPTWLKRMEVAEDAYKGINTGAL